MNLRELVDARHLAQRWHVRPATVLAWARRGWIPCLRAGQRPVLFDLEEVEQALRERANRPGTARHPSPQF